MQTPTYSHFNNEIDIDLHDIDFSNVSKESVYDFICEILGGIHISFPDVLRDIVPPQSNWTNIDRDELVSYSTTVQYAVEMSSEQAVKEEEKKKRTSRRCAFCARTCDCPRDDSPTESFVEHVREASKLQENRVGLSDLEECEEAVLLTPASTSSNNDVSSSPRKTVRFASPSSLCSPSKKRRTRDSSPPKSDSRSIITAEILETLEDLEPVVTTHEHPTLTPEEHFRLEIPILDPSADPCEDVCMSGALSPDFSNTALSDPSSTRANRLQIMLTENDSTVCSDDLNLQVANMPFRLVSKEEFLTMWASSFLEDLDRADAELPDRFFTTPLGIAEAKKLSDDWCQELIEHNIKILKEENPTLSDDDIAYKTVLFKRSPFVRREFDKRGRTVLFYFGGEFNRHDYACVKYPENLINYVAAFEDLEYAANVPEVCNFWEEFYARGTAFWDEFEEESDVEDRETELGANESEDKDQVEKLFDGIPDQSHQKCESDAVVKQENGL